ncbi:uncharacterized protein LOC125195318 [Salvia hispanica]|uniref:uncharacterized protein LOC125195318 n=1 Tax=Salvia hispanica TaxID=49212 RepID=UPI0020093648|nr:uncharacterized protein LOC125195318 [Salvia hispanica]
MSKGYSHTQAPQVHLCFILVILSMFLGITWYINYESIFQPLFHQIKLFLIVSPLLLLLTLHLFTAFNASFSSRPLPEQNRAGGTPWGLGLLLFLLFLMISYHSDFQDRLFPLLS